MPSHEQPLRDAPGLRLRSRDAAARRAQRRAPAETGRSATEIAAEEMDRIVTDWFGEVLQTSPIGSEQTLSTRGRLALLLADMPGKWQDQFLRPGPWPQEFVEAMRESFFRAGPDFQLSKMTPRQLDLGALAKLTKFGNLPYVRMVLVWGFFALLLVAIFWLTHGGFETVRNQFQLLLEWFKEHG